MYPRPSTAYPSDASVYPLLSNLVKQPFHFLISKKKLAYRTLIHSSCTSHFALLSIFCFALCHRWPVIRPQFLPLSGKENLSWYVQIQANMIMTGWCAHALYIYIAFCLLPVLRAPPYPSILHLACILLAFCLHFAFCQCPIYLRCFLLVANFAHSDLIHLHCARPAIYNYIAFCLLSACILLVASHTHLVPSFRVSTNDGTLIRKHQINVEQIWRKKGKKDCKHGSRDGRKKEVKHIGRE